MTAYQDYHVGPFDPFTPLLRPATQAIDGASRVFEMDSEVFPGQNKVKRLIAYSRSQHSVRLTM